MNLPNNSHYSPLDFKAGCGHNSKIEHGNKKFRIEKWYKGNGYTFLIVDISENQVEPFYKNPAEIKEMIRNNKIKITN